MLRPKILGCLPLVLAALPQPAAAFAYSAVNDGGDLVLVAEGLPPIVWREAVVSFTIDISDPGLAQDTLTAMNEWSEVSDSIELSSGSARGDVCDHLDGANVVMLTTDNCGETFGDILALTHYQTVSVAGTHYIVDTDILVQDLAAVRDQWATQTEVAANRRFNESRLCVAGVSFGTKTCDYYRVILHELGHALGLGHPDEIGQTRTAVMNSGASNLNKPFHLASDDIAGLLTLYPDARGPRPGVGGTGTLPSAVNEEGGNSGSLSTVGLIALALAAVQRRRRRSASL